MIIDVDRLFYLIDWSVSNIIEEYRYRLIKIPTELWLCKFRLLQVELFISLFGSNKSISVVKVERNSKCPDIYWVMISCKYTYTELSAEKAYNAWAAVCAERRRRFQRVEVACHQITDTIVELMNLNSFRRDEVRKQSVFAFKSFKVFENKKKGHTSG